MEKRKRTGKIISYSIAILVIAGLSVALALAVERQNQYRIDLENMYEKSYYDTMSSVSLLETNLDKLSVSTDKNMQIILLSDICRESERAESNLSQLNSKEEPIDNIIKFFNQVGDYCNSVSGKIEDGQEISDEDYQRMLKFSNNLTIIWTNLQSVQEELIQGNTLMGKFNGNLNYLTQAYSNINNSEDATFNDEMNYDGPFSDDVVKRQAPKALENEELVSADDCLEKIKEFFPDKNVKVTKIGESGGVNTDGEEYDIYMPNYIFEVEAGNVKGTMQLSKKGGYLINFDGYKAVNSHNLEEDECIEKAQEFLSNVGYQNMQDIWTSNYNSTLYINFVYVQDDVFIYPDMIKIKVACDTGDIIGFEAQNYLYNHREDRDLSDKKSIEEMEYEHNDKLTLEDSRIVVIPNDYNEEITVAEYVLSREEDIFYVYVDMEDGRERKILKLIEDDGKKLV